jgi:hypothetical protein
MISLDAAERVKDLFERRYDLISSSENSTIVRLILLREKIGERAEIFPFREKIHPPSNNSLVPSHPRLFAYKYAPPCFCVSYFIICNFLLSLPSSLCEAEELRNISTPSRDCWIIGLLEIQASSQTSNPISTSRHLTTICPIGQDFIPVIF